MVGVVDDKLQSATFFQNVLEGYQKDNIAFVQIDGDIGQINEFVKDNTISVLMINAHFKTGLRGNFFGIDLAWDIRCGKLQRYNTDQPNSRLLSLPIIIYSVVDQKYLAAYSIDMFGQNIFMIPYSNSACEFVSLIHTPEQIRLDMAKKIKSLIELRCLPEDIGADIYHTRLRKLTIQFIKDFRHDIRTSLQVDSINLPTFLKSLTRMKMDCEHVIGEIDLIDCLLYKVISEVHSIIDSVLQGQAILDLKMRNRIVELQESVRNNSELFMLYACDMRSLFPQSIKQRTGVLIIEDDEDARTYYQKLLVDDLEFSWKNIVSCDGKLNPNETVDLIEEQFDNLLRIEIVLVDLMLYQNRDAGIEILRKIKFKYPHIRIIVISGRNDVQLETLSYGADYYITKPVSQDSFTKIIEQSMFQKRILYLETDQSYAENKEVISSFRLSKDNDVSAHYKVEQLFDNIFKYFGASWIKFERHRTNTIPSSEINSKIADGYYNLIILDAFVLNQSWEKGKMLFRYIRSLSDDIPLIILAATALGDLKNNLIFQELKHYFRIDYDDFWVKQLSFDRLRQIKKIFKQQNAIKYNVRYTLLLPKISPKKEEFVEDIRKKNIQLKNKYLELINVDFGGATIWEGEGFWRNGAKSEKDDHFIVHVLTRYAPGNRNKLLTLISEYGKETDQEAIFLQEERVNTYEKLKKDY